MSALSLLGMPAEVYTQGTQFFAVVFTLPLVCYLTGQVYIPVFHSLQIQSSYQYLELRFNHAVSDTGHIVVSCNAIIRSE